METVNKNSKNRRKYSAIPFKLFKYQNSMLFCRALNWEMRLTKKALQVCVEAKTIYLSILLTKFHVLGNITKFFYNTIRIFPTGSDHIIQFIPRFWFLLPTLVFESFTTVCITDLL